MEIFSPFSLPNQNNYFNPGSRKGIQRSHHSNEFLITVNDAGNLPNLKTGLAFFNPFGRIEKRKPTKIQFKCRMNRQKSLVSMKVNFLILDNIWVNEEI